MQSNTPETYVLYIRSSGKQSHLYRTGHYRKDEWSFLLSSFNFYTCPLHLFCHPLHPLSSTSFPMHPFSSSRHPSPSPTFDQPGKEAAVADEGLPLQGVPVHVLQLALLCTRVPAGEGGADPVHGTWVYTCTYIHTYVHTVYRLPRKPVHISTLHSVHAHGHAHIHTYIYIQPHVHMYIRTYTHPHTHTPTVSSPPPTPTPTVSSPPPTHTPTVSSPPPTPTCTAAPLWSQPWQG